MQLSIADVAKLCGVSENEVFRWVRRDGLPAERINDVFRVNAVELLEWASMTKHPVSPTIFQALNGDSIGKLGLTEALEAGGIVRDVAGSELKTVFATAVEGIALPQGFDRQNLVDLLIAREALGSTAIGNGIAIPHPRRPIVLPGAARLLRLCFLSSPIEFGAPKGNSVNTLFILISPTVRDHQQLLARLANVLRDENFQRLLRTRAAAETIVGEVRKLEVQFQTA